MRITRIVAIFYYYSGLDALFYWLNRRAKRIITFHNVLPRELWQANLANGVSNSLDDLKAIVGIVAQRFKFSTDVLDNKTATITFDDGYHNQYAYAFKTLKTMGIPAIVFAAEDVQKGPLLIDKLLHWVSYAPLELIPDGNRRQYWEKTVWPRFMKDGFTRGQALMKELEKEFPYEKIEALLNVAYRKERLSGISEVEKEEMRNAGWLIGWHTKSHYPLSQLSAAEVREELESPAEYRNVCLSFPYGNPVEVGETAIKLAEELGYLCAVSDCNESEWNTSRYFLPRMALTADKYLLHFELSGAKYFLKYHRRLPTL